MSTYDEHLSRMIDDYVGRGDYFSVADIADDFITANGTLVSAEADRLIHRETVNRIKSILRRREEDNGATGQLSIPGIDLPSVVAVPAEVAGGHLYKSTLDCTWSDLEGAREIRRRNLEAVRTAYDVFNDSLESLRASMADDKNITVREAIGRFGQQAA